jgi:hypothetical protein
MKRALALLAIFLVLFVAILPGSASAGGGWHHGHRGGHGGWWWPGALIGGLALGAVALATAPLWAFTPAPAAPAPVVMQAPPVVQTPAAYAQPAYSAPATLPVPPPGSAPVAYAPAPAANYQPAQSYAASAVQREVIHDNGRYVLYGDGVRQPWQWVWVPAAAPPPPPPPPR